jgi:hypothetical protein
MAAEMAKTPSTRNHDELEKPDRAFSGVAIPKSMARTIRAMETAWYEN